MEFGRDVVEVAFKNLQREGLRTFLTLIGVIIGIAAIVSLLSIGNGLTLVVEDNFQTLGSNTVFVIPSGSMGFMKYKISQIDIDTIRNTSGVDSAIPIYSKSGMMEYNGERVNVSILAVDPKEAMPVFESSGFMEVIDGRRLEKNDSEGILIGTKLSTDFFERELGVKKQVLINGLNYSVAGILKPQQSGMSGSSNMGGSIYMSLEALKRLYPESTLNPSIIFIKTLSANDAKEVAENLQDYFDKKYGKDSITVSSSEELLEQVKSFLNLITLFITGIGAVSMLVGGIGIMNSMITSVMERTREIGLMKALGSSNEKIKSIFLLEAALIGGIGGAIGIILGYLMSFTIALIGQSMGYGLNASMGIEITIGALIFSMIVGCISGVLPAIRASNLDPVVALRYE